MYVQGCVCVCPFESQRCVFLVDQIQKFEGECVLSCEARVSEKKDVSMSWKQDE